MRTSQLGVWLVAATALVGGVAGARDTSLSQGVPRLRVPLSLDAPPESIVAGMEVRERFLRELRPVSIGGHTPRFVFRLVRRWSPGQTLRVAFLGGSRLLQADVANVAVEWSKYANIKFDFGGDSADGPFRSWTREDTDYTAEIRISFGERGFWSVVGRDSIEPTINAPNEPSMNFGAFTFASRVWARAWA